MSLAAIGIASDTNTAWITDLTEGSDKSGASVMASCANMLGLAVGPLMGGMLAQYVPAPLQLSFCIYLALQVVMALFIRQTLERSEWPGLTLREVSLRPRIGIPPGILGRFFSPAATVFATFAMTSFYAALLPSLLVRDLRISNLTIGGDVDFELFLAAALAIILTRRLQSRTAMLGGLALLVPSLAMLMLSQGTPFTSGPPCRNRCERTCRSSGVNVSSPNRIPKPGYTTIISTKEVHHERSAGS
ncbi:MFS transporter [Geobacter argillaceus]|uniref:MFS transporter n=1 Tax=Geobacter argillaceus TaxID=345631 RepID=A0A562VF75_9BACT|nr:MFS transporter [Geobacter argillaceus]